MVAEDGQKKLAEKERKKQSYRDYLLENSNFADGEGMAPFYPRRYMKKKYWKNYESRAVCKFFCLCKTKLTFLAL